MGAQFTLGSIAEALGATRMERGRKIDKVRALEKRVRDLEAGPHG